VYGGDDDSARTRAGVFLGGRGDEKKTIFVKNHYFKKRTTHTFF
jgi:hypothetical protein